MLSGSATDKHHYHLFPTASLLDSLQKHVFPQAAHNSDSQQPLDRILKDSKMQHTKLIGKKINSPL